MQKQWTSIRVWGFGILALVITLAGCVSQAEPPDHSPEAFILVGDASDGTLSIIEHGDDGSSVSKTIPLGSGGIGDMVATTEDHVFINVTGNNQVAVIDPMAEDLPELSNYLASGTSPVHAYRDPEGTRVWVMNDGNATSGTCLTAGPGGTATSSVTVIQNHTVGGAGGSSGLLGEVIATICVGRGHHKAAFSYPSTDQPGVPDRTFVSNITDGTVSAIDNDPASGTYLEVISTIDLCDSAKEQAMGNPACDVEDPDEIVPATPDSAIPHGMDFSPVSGKIYNANVVYGTIAVIDPITATLETVIDIGFSGKTHVSPDGNFAVTAGADGNSDPDHIIGKLTVIDVSDNSFSTIDIADVYLDTLEFTPDGEKLYVTSALSGSDPQKANIKNDVLLVFDTSSLPVLTPPTEIEIGHTDEEHRALAIHEHDGEAEHVFVPNPEESSVSVIDAETDTVVDTVTVGGEPSSILVFPVEGGHAH